MGCREGWGVWVVVGVGLVGVRAVAPLVAGSSRSSSSGALVTVTAKGEPRKEHA